MKKTIEEKRDDYYSLDCMLDSMTEKLESLKRNRGRTYAFKMLSMSIRLMQQQVRDDYTRYVKRIEEKSCRNDMADMQKSLNREVIKNKLLEKKIEEAKTSSGLFIDFVREKMGL